MQELETYQRDIVEATNTFSNSNKIGECGFGPVYNKR